MAESISAISAKFKALEEEELERFIREYQQDERSGVQKIIGQAEKKISFYENERKRLEKMRQYEHKHSDCRYICGIDEAGRGPLAGPVVAGAVILPKDIDIWYLNDSKQVTEKRREALYEQIMECAVAVGVGIVPAERIDEINILQATYEAMRQAVAGLSVTPDMLLVDAVHIPGISIRQAGIIKGDTLSVSIAAASIIAKVTRDRMMREYDQLYPGYGFSANKGYGGSEVHRDALKKLGPCPIHRKTFIQGIMG